MSTSSSSRWSAADRNVELAEVGGDAKQDNAGHIVDGCFERTATLADGDGPNQFYPIYIDDGHGAGSLGSASRSHLASTARGRHEPPTECRAVWPIRRDGTKMTWRCHRRALRECIAEWTGPISREAESDSRRVSSYL